LISEAGTYALLEPRYTCTHWEVEATAKREPVGDQLMQHTAPGKRKERKEEDEGKKEI